jgi:DNA-3-methyladenine glycosylase
MHWCFNVVSDREEVPTACLIRALEPVVGLDEMRRRRGKERADELCSGPAKLAQALGVDRSLNGVDLVRDNRIFIERGRSRRSPLLVRSRVGVGYGGSWAAKRLRFSLVGFT